MESIDIMTLAEPRVFKPAVIETKEQLLMELKKGNLKTSRYHTLSEREKLFVELMAFGDYTAEQAIKAIDKNTPVRPNIARARANRMLANEDVAATLEELTMARNKKFMTEINSARDKALNKLIYIMNTTNDEAVAAACAKTILDKGEKALQQPKQADEEISGVTFRIESVNINAQPAPEKIVVDLGQVVDADIIDPTEHVPPEEQPDYNPFKLHYEAEDLYTKKDH